ncbi:hypothetical protein OB919_03890 [Halobacteria archaeon AArc-curdl1]|uniref:Uncharacterized protein n=1 Tax=Natronosalvus hydrolyticus TaxID=2979988 RepID=A0AAP2Z658_9EURY|nr:hypothetical protein [Halobacteria archaeon AArc-curdl1]
MSTASRFDNMGPSDVLTVVAFWLGALLPLAYLPVILTGLNSTTRLGLFLALLVLHVVALVVGHEYPRTRQRAAR